jgi:hypothetical protein
MKSLDENLGFRLLGIQMTNFELFSELAGTGHELTIAAKLDWRVDPAARVIVAQLGLDYLAGNHRLVALSIENSFELELAAWEAACGSQHKTIELPRAFLMQLGSITIGTARGVLYAKTSDPGRTQYVLPLLDVGRLLTAHVQLSWQ